MRLLLLVVVVATGAWIRTLPALREPPGGTWWPWNRSSTVTLYFTKGAFLFPVSHRSPGGADALQEALQALLDGPRASSGLSSAVPRGVQIRSVGLADGAAAVDLSATLLSARDLPAARSAIVRTLLSVPGVQRATLRINGAAAGGVEGPVVVLYYPSAAGLVGVPASATNPHDLLREYLAGPPAPELTGMPSDVRLADYTLEPDSGALSLGFSYTPSLRTLATESPDRMRFLLLGLIASLTGLPEVKTVRLDFGGQSRLGLGQCSDLLRTPQRRPALLNDERLLN